MPPPTTTVLLLAGLHLVSGTPVVSGAARPTGGPLVPAAPDTVLFRGDAARTGHYRTRGVESLGGLQWRFATGGPVRSTPAVRDGVVYVGSGDGRLYALDRRSGRERWRFDAGSSVASSPAVADGRVFFGDRAGRFHALDAHTGEEVWRVATGPEASWAWGHESADIFTSSPAVVDGRVVFGSGDGRVHAVRADDGGALWSTPVNGRVRSSPAVRDGVVVVGSADGSVYVLSLDDGSVLERFDTEGRSLRSADFGFDRKTVQSTPAVVDGRVFVGAKDGHLYAFDLGEGGPGDGEPGEGGEGRWAWRSDHRVSWVLGGPAVADGVVWTGTSDGRFVQAVDAGSGRELWRVETPSSVWTSPAVAGGAVYVADNAGWVRALDRTSGEELWSYRTGARVQSSPVPDDGMLFVGSDDGGVYAFREGPPVRRAVFRDSALARAAWYRGHDELADHLVAAGYRELDSDGLVAFLEARSDDGAPSVVVFAMDVLPAVAAEGGPSSLLRRYLEAGGKVVWVGVPPLLWRRDPATGSPGDLTAIDRDATEGLLGVPHDRGNFDAYGARPTAAGRRWGLTGWWMTRWAATPVPGLVPLALNELGLAAAWVRSYGGPPGTGFVRVWGDVGPMPDPEVAHVIAEYRPLPASGGAGERGMR